MTIETYYEKFREALANGISLYSDPHIISGYKMRLQVSLNGQGDGEGTHMSVFFQLMKGKLDDYLKWPFDKLIDFVLIHQDDQSKCFTRTLTTAKMLKPLNQQILKNLSAIVIYHGDIISL